MDRQTPPKKMKFVQNHFADVSDDSEKKKWSKKKLRKKFRKKNFDKIFFGFWWFVHQIWVKNIQ